MTSKVKGSEGIEFPDGTVQGSAAYSKAQSDGPVFSAYQSPAQAALPAATNTKLLFQVEEFDTANAFSNSRFQPSVAGYYLITGATRAATGNSGINIWKNGVKVKNGSFGAIPNCSAIVFLNGSTDYVELFGYFELSSAPFAGEYETYFQGTLVRKA